MENTTNISAPARKVLVVVDMQNDFIDGTLGSPAAQAILPAVLKKIESFDGYVVATRDTHFANYFQTLEGERLPVNHCTVGSDGWQVQKDVIAAMEKKPFLGYVDKVTFGSIQIPQSVAAIPGFGKDFEIELLGLDTDICVVSNALMLRANFPDNKMTVDASCCAGSSPDRHAAALATMKSCQIDVINE